MTTCVILLITSVFVSNSNHPYIIEGPSSKNGTKLRMRVFDRDIGPETIIQVDLDLISQKEDLPVVTVLAENFLMLPNTAKISEVFKNAKWDGNKFANVNVNGQMFSISYCHCKKRWEMSSIVELTK